MIARILVALGCLVPGIGLWADDLQHLGNFNNVSSNDGGEHCAGYSLGLWKHGAVIFGLLDVHSGLCGDPPCAVIRDASLEAGTGKLRFGSTVIGRRIRFDGTMARGAIDGRIDGKRLHLSKDAPAPDFEPNRSLSAWCAFWGSVPRCKGVRENCEAMGVR